MLNGRVYGRRRPYNKASTDPFANVRDTEPEFVEWGYGGMGSNKSNTNSSMGSAWKAVQNGSNASAFGNDEDDATGMAWVKKRRAAREKAKLEAEKLQVVQPGDTEVVSAEPMAAEEAVHEPPESLEEDQLSPPVVETSTTVPVEQQREKPEHITTAINLPPHRVHKREPSFGHRVQIPQVAESPIKEKPSFGVDFLDTDPGEKPDASPTVPEPNADSTSEDEDSSTDGDDEDESDSYSEENAHSKTTLGAGVEKVSRHKDIPQPKAPNLPHSTLKTQLPTTAIEA